MAQILIKRSAVAAKIPATADIALGELAINTYDGKLYLKKSVSGVETVVQVGDPTTAPVQSVFGRTGAVVLQSSDVTTALTYTPVNKAGDTMTGALNGTSFVGPLTGNASTATTLQTSRSISATGDATWTVNFNGAANATAALTLAASGVTAGTYNSVTVDAKGRVTGASNISATTQLGYTPVNKAGDSMSGPLSVVGIAPVIYYDETDQTGAVGKWRLVADGGNWRVDQNTATARDFSTFTTGLQVASNGVVSAPSFSGPLTGAVTGNASTATTLATARNLSVSGDATGSVSFNGSADAAIPMTLAASGVIAGTYTKLTVDAKGRATAGTQLTSADVTTALGYTPSSSANAGAPNGAATLDSNGKLLASQVPAIAISDTFVVATQAAMLALSTAEVGDIAVRTDLNKSFILKTADASTLANWQELLTPTDAVSSVAGRTGAVTLTTADLSGVMNVINGGTGVTTSTGSGNNVLSVSPTFTGTANFASLLATGGMTVSNGSDGMVNFGGDANGTIELGKIGRTVAGTPYIDFHSAAGSLDYDVRIIASGGSGTTGGLGTLNLIAGGGVLVNGGYVNKAGDLTTGYDFNSYTTTGVWYQNSDANAATATNAPSTVSGQLTVKNSGNTIGIWQTYDTYRVNATPRQFRRQFYNSVWSAWVETGTSANSTTVNPTTPKDGDVQVAAGPTISIYASGAWRQIFPAVYS